MNNNTDLYINASFGYGKYIAVYPSSIGDIGNADPAHCWNDSLRWSVGGQFYIIDDEYDLPPGRTLNEESMATYHWQFIQKYRIVHMYRDDIAGTILIGWLAEEKQYFIGQQNWRLDFDQRRCGKPKLSMRSNWWMYNQPRRNQSRAGTWAIPDMLLAENRP